MIEKNEETTKRITLLFDMTNDGDKNIIEKLNKYISDYNEKAKIVFKDQKKKNFKITEADALKRYVENKGDFKIIDDLVNSLDEESFYSYAHQAHCKKTGVDIGKFDFFRNELHKYKDQELKKMVSSLFIQ